MNLLAIDTSAAACSVAVSHDRHVVQRLTVMQRGHAEALLPMVMATLKDSGLGFADLQALAVTVGPGAFTGLRVGVAAARGLALAAGLPCFGVSSLAALAEAAGLDGDTTILSVLDTRRGDFYAQQFCRFRELAPPFILDCAQRGDSNVSISEVFDETLQRSAPLAVTGDGRAAVAEALRGAGIVTQEVEGTDYPTATAVANLAVRRWEAGERPAAPPDPLYLRSASVSGGVVS